MAGHLVTALNEHLTYVKRLCLGFTSKSLLVCAGSRQTRRGALAVLVARFSALFHEAVECHPVKIKHDIPSGVSFSPLRIPARERESDQTVVPA
jgi:hypothetical protein